MKPTTYKIGSKLRLAVEVKSPQFTMDDIDFSIRFFVQGRGGAIVAKSEMARESENKYLAPLDTNLLDREGIVQAEFTAIVTTYDVGETKYTKVWVTDVAVMK